MWSIPTAVALLDEGTPRLDRYLPLIEARRAASRCPMCLRDHTMKPTGCLALAERRHAALCAHPLSAHAEGCRLVAMQHYVATLAD